MTGHSDYLFLTGGRALQEATQQYGHPQVSGIHPTRCQGGGGRLTSGKAVSTGWMRQIPRHSQVPMRIVRIAYPQRGQDPRSSAWHLPIHHAWINNAVAESSHFSNEIISCPERY